MAVEHKTVRGKKNSKRNSAGAAETRRARVRLFLGSERCEPKLIRRGLTQTKRERGLARATFLVDDPIPWQTGCPPGRRLTGHAPTGSHPGTRPSGAPRRAKEG
ncbi:hypothetical protein IscW_ISCW022388 [Ixodes scapularis]|uniref:Uncharacterized protein n=1 Tax=Ixodes scapularis TaxID=6945 RepID=B7QGI0_IXOSC|nr:hypothetical protein IscW_ISCW022388 [Ixodes scapularis]|eukprot:XP_002401810.1 hypothetical protein IscW_ISCW022388 [Ixodes scapularis]